MNEFWSVAAPLLGSALGGAIVAGGFGMLNNRTAKNDEHDKWLRDQKMDAYQLYADMQGALMHAMSADWAGHGSTEAVVKAFGAAQGHLDIVAPAGVRESASAFGDYVGGAAQEYLLGSLKRDSERMVSFLAEYKRLAEEFIQVARQDLDIESEDYAVSGSELKDSAVSATRNVGNVHEAGREN